MYVARDLLELTMNRMTASVLLLILTCACKTGQSPEPRTAPAAHQPAELEQLSTQWMDAMLHHDRARLEQLMAPEYVLHTPDPKHPETPRAEWLDNLFNSLKIDQWDQKDVSAHLYGELGVVTSTYSWSGTFHDKAFDSKGHCTDVWQSGNGHWQVVARTCLAFPGSLTLGGVSK